MHELSLLENVRSILEEHALSQGFQTVENITLEIGALSCVELDALTFAFESVMKDSLAEYAELTFKIIEGQGRCVECGQLTPMSELYDVCAYCGHFRVEILSGLEMKITELKVR